MTIQQMILIYIGGINIISLMMYGIDKHKAKIHAWRIPESTLICLAAAGGGAGCWSAMHLFHHKTKHRKFTILVPMFTILWTVGLVYFYIVKKA